MDYRKFGNKIVLRLKKGDKVIESIEKLVRKENITACSFQGIGAVDYLKLGFWKPGSTDYKWSSYDEDFEVTSLIGNVTIFDDEPMVHAHITCGRSNSEIIGGHLGEATCSLTLEIFVDVIGAKIRKKHDDDLGINTIEFE